MSEKVKGYNSKFRVIPVIDILNGVVVHAFRGKRSEYKKIEGILSKSADPVELAEAFRSLGFDELYVADLDAIIDCIDDFPVLKCIAEKTGLKLLVDAGITSVERAERLLGSGVAKIVVGTETLQDMTFVEDAIKRFGSDRVLVSLDLKDRKVLTKSGFDNSIDPIGLLQSFKMMGISEVIVLDLSKVGSAEGVDINFLKKIIKKVKVRVLVGGGVRDLQDLLELRATGVSGALVATALHKGKINVIDLKLNEFI
jgi:phosphoribosylformimino-5-aminoimidazole carboxamide ribotide isomerase